MLFAFLDTSVLLHYQFFTDVDWTRELGDRDVTLVLAPIVVSELDDKKSSGGRRERRRAAQVIDRLFKEEASETPVSLRNGVQLMALHSPPEDGTFARHHLTQSSQDDRQLASIFDFLARGHTVCLLSADYGLTMRAKGRGIDARRPAAELKLPDEPDDTERELENVRRELASLLAAMPKPRVTFPGEETRLAWSYSPVKPFDETIIERLVYDWQVQNPKVSTGQSRPLRVGDVSVNLGILPFSEQQSRDYNHALDAAQDQYEAFLRETWPFAVERSRLVVPFDLILANGGTKPAEDVEIELSTDARATWSEEDFTLPFAPDPPEYPGRHHLTERFRPPIDELLIPRVDLFDNVKGPNVSNTAPQTVRYTVKRAQHHVWYDLPRIYLHFDSAAAVQSFNVQVLILASNLPERLTQHLDVQVTRSAPTSPHRPRFRPDK